MHSRAFPAGPGNNLLERSAACRTRGPPPRAARDPDRLPGSPVQSEPALDGTADPFRTARQLVRLKPRGARTARLEALLAQVSLTGDLLARYPHELSTGQCQRICIARALAPEPKLLVLDEPLSALDVSVQARVLRILSDLHERTGISYLLITHDFAVVRDICQRVIVLDKGRIVQSGTVEDVLDRASDARTRSLLADVLPLAFTTPPTDTAITDGAARHE